MFLAENIHKNRSSIVLIGEHLFMHKDAYQSRKNLRNGMPGLYADTERLVTATFSKSGLIVFLNCVMCTFGTVPNKTDKEGCMETYLQLMIVLFLTLLCLLCLFAVFVIVRDIVSESAESRRKRTDKPDGAAERNVTNKEDVYEKNDVLAGDREESAACAAVVSADVLQNLDASDTIGVQETLLAENAVAFEKNNVSLEERYEALSSQQKAYFEDICRYAKEKTDVKENRRENYIDYKTGSYRVLRLTIKRGEIVCVFNFMDRDILNYAKAENAKVKRAPTTVRVVEASDVGVAKDGIDLVCRQIDEDKALRKRLALEKRRENARKRRSQEKAEEVAVSSSEDVKDKIGV